MLVCSVADEDRDLSASSDLDPIFFTMTDFVAAEVLVEPRGTEPDLDDLEPLSSFDGSVAVEQGGDIELDCDLSLLPGPALSFLPTDSAVAIEFVESRDTECDLADLERRLSLERSPATE